MAWWSTENRFALISLPNVYQVMGIMKVELTEDLSPLQKLESRGDEWKRILILHCHIIETSKVFQGWRTPSFFPTKKKPAPAGDKEGAREPEMPLSIACHSGPINK